MKKKRALGGGRKPKGDFSRAISPLSIRMPEDMRAELETAATNNGRSVTQELLRRIQDSFYRDRDKTRDPAQRALCFMITELADNVTSGAERDRKFNWRTDPFFFRAFKIAVGLLLDALEPSGEMEPPPEQEAVAGADALELEMLKSFRSPEERATFVALHCMHSLRFAHPSWASGLRPEIKADVERHYYGMADARRDLKITDDFNNPFPKKTAPKSSWRGRS
jgi:Arc-like DNA binding domain